MKRLILAALAALTGLTFASGVASATGSGDQDAVSYAAEMNAAATSASDYVTATSSAPWSEGGNWLHQPKHITADHWSYLRLWADCGHGCRSDNC